MKERQAESALEAKMHRIARDCEEYEAITAAQGYGYSLLTNVKAVQYPRCDWCVNWFGGTCEIYERNNHCSN